MKFVCEECSERFNDDEGELKAGKFVCNDCIQTGAAEKEEFSECPKCREASEEFEEEGVCPHCGAAREEEKEAAGEEDEA